MLNKVDLIPEEERQAGIDAFLRAYDWRGPVFAISAINGDGCRPLIHAIMAHLEEQRKSESEQ